MTKFEELMDLITHNKNKGKRPAIKIAEVKEDNDIQLEVSGSESTRAH